MKREYAEKGERRYMNDRTFAATVLTPWFMREHRETEEQHLRERALLEAAKEIEDGKKYVIEITTETTEWYGMDATETRVKIQVEEMEIVPVMIGIDWSGCEPQPKKRRKGWRRRTWKRR